LVYNVMRNLCTPECDSRVTSVQQKSAFCMQYWLSLSFKRVAQIAIINTGYSLAILVILYAILVIFSGVLVE